MRHVGRRRLYLVGLIGMVIFLIVIGGMGFISTSNSGAQWAIGALLLLYTALYDGTVGPVCYSLGKLCGEARIRRLSVKFHV